MAGDGSVLLAGFTMGDWDGDNAGGEGYAAVKLDTESDEHCRWQVTRTGAGG